MFNQNQLVNEAVAIADPYRPAILLPSAGYRDDLAELSLKNRNARKRNDGNLDVNKVAKDAEKKNRKQELYVFELKY